MMLEIGDDDFVAGPDMLLSECSRDEIDRFGRAAREDDLFIRSSTEETRYFRARAFVGVGRASGKLVRRPVNVRIFVLIEIFEPLDDRFGLLSRRRVVEPDERTAVDRLIQNRKIAANAVDIETDATRRWQTGRCSRPRNADTAR